MNRSEAVLREVGRRYHSVVNCGRASRVPLRSTKPRRLTTDTASTGESATKATRSKLNQVTAEEVALRNAVRRRNLAIAALGVAVGHGVTIAGWMHMDRIAIPGTEMQVNLAPGLGFVAYAAITRGTGGLVFYVLGQAALAVATLSSGVWYMHQWVEERTPPVGPTDISDVLGLLNDLRAQTPPPTRVDLTSGHITQTSGMDAAIVVGLRSFYATFFSQGTGGMTKARLKAFLEGDVALSGEMVLPGGVHLTGASLTQSHFHMVDQIFNFLDFDGDGSVTFREFAFAALMFWAARDGNTQAQQVVMFKLMDSNKDGKISAEELTPWVQLLNKAGKIPEEDLTVRCWHLLAFRDVSEAELARKYVKEVDKDRDGKINMVEFARMSTKFPFDAVFAAMTEPREQAAAIAAQ